MIYKKTLNSHYFKNSSSEDNSKPAVQPIAALLTNSESLGHLGNFLDFYSTKVADVDTKMFDLNKQLEKTEEELAVAQRELRQIGGHGQNHIKLFLSLI